jgi:hypothetical protein
VGAREGAAGEAVGKSLVGPADQAGPERDGEAEVRGGQAVSGLRAGAATQVEHAGAQEHEVDEWHACEQDRAESPAAQQIPGDEAGRENDPEGDLAGDDDGDERVHAASAPSRFSTSPSLSLSTSLLAGDPGRARLAAARVGGTTAPVMVRSVGVVAVVRWEGGGGYA